MKLLVATLFLSGVLSAPFNSLLDKPAAPECNIDASRFHTKKSLLYSYEGETITGLVGTSEVRSGLKIKAKCQITPVLPCRYMLQILEAELLEDQGKNKDTLDFKLSSGSENLSGELTAQDLYFDSHNGVITNIRPQVDEKERVLNIKRGILSAFQLKLVDESHTFTEIDVNGECSADYEIKARHDSGRVKTVLKTKDLSLCKDRSETNLGIPVANYPIDKPFSLLKSNSLCKFVMSPRQRIGKVSCEETHLFRPFSAGYNSSSGAITTVRQSLKMIGHGLMNDEEKSMPATRLASLRYEHTKDDETFTKNYKEVQNILQKLGQEEGANPDTARLFTKLIFAVRRLETKALKYVWYQHYECLQRDKCTKEQSERYQKYIVDALSQCGTLHCAQFMVSAISDNKVGTPQSVAFLTGIALVGKPSEDMVGNILYFCQETPSRTAFLTLGTLMHKYCRQHSCDKLTSYSQIYQAEKFLKRKLAKNCQTSTPKELEAITLALKAIGNAGRPYTSLGNILKCAVQPGPTFINVDAIQALRRMPCSDDMTKGLLNIFDDFTMDTEIRIETYLALMRCPSQKVVQKIADILDTEKNNQVGSFVWSHLTNALESTEPVYGIPLREAISKALQERKLRPFKLDHLRFSHAYEASYYNKKHEVGGSSQAQVVFHPDSYFPRSAKLNFTVDVLGASVNLLETAARFEGFETLIERMFGPEGYFPDESLMKLLKIKSTEASSRDRRSAAEDEMDEIKTNLEKLQDKMQIERKNPTGALSLKVFGHELQFLNFEDIDWLQGEADSINVIDTLINIARGGKVTYTKSFMLLEANHEIPTALGIPLKLAVNGSGVSSVTLKGKFDIRNMFWGKKKFDVRGYITPSATIDISGKMTVDAIHASSGIHVNSSLYTSTEINGNATYKEGEGIKLSVEPPTKPIYIVNVKSNLASFLNEKREKLPGASRRFEHKNCANFTRFLGVNLCGQVSVPMAYRDYNAPYFPLSGDSSFEMVFHTTNPNLARFQVEGQKLTSEDKNRYDWMFNVHIPGLTFGRKVVGNSTFQFLEDGKYLSVSCGIHDYKFGKFEAKYNNVTNRLHTKFSTPSMAYLRPVTVETEVFNTRNNKTMDIGIAINASYNNFTIQDLLSFHKHKDQYGFKSKLTYWPRKHITTVARFSMKKKKMYIKIDDSGSTNRFSFAGNLGTTTNRFYAKFGNGLVNYEMKMNGELHKTNKKVMVNIITKPSWNVVKFEAYPKVNALEKGFYMRLSHVNSSSHVTGYLGMSKFNSMLMFNGMFKKKPFLLRASHYFLSNGRKVEWVAQGFGNNANASVEYSAKKWSKHNLELSAAVNDKKITAGVFLRETGVGAYFQGMDKTFDADASHWEEGQRQGLSVSVEMDRLTKNSKKIKAAIELARGDKETDLKLGINGLGYKTNLVWSYYSQKNETGLKMNAYASNKNTIKQIELQTGLFRYPNEKGLRVAANILNKKFEAKWSILDGGRSGLKFVAVYMKNEVSLQSTWFSGKNLKEWRVDAGYDGKTASWISTYRPKDKYFCSEIAGLSADRLVACLQLINSDGEKALRLVAEGLGSTGEMKAGWIQNAEAKGAILQISYNDKEVSNLFVGLVTGRQDTGLQLKGNVKGKSIEALFKYKNTPSKRSIDLDLRVQGKLVTFESVLLRDPSLQGIEVNMIYQSNRVGSLFAHLVKKTSKKLLRIGGQTMNYVAAYKLSLSSTKLEKKLSSMVNFNTPSTHYKYGYSLSHINSGGVGLSNHLLTTNLHYAKDKVLTSTYQFINSEQIFSLLSKVELAPGQFITNKIAYSKPNRKLSIKCEVLPDIGMSYLALFTNNEQVIAVKSNLTILDYPMDSSAVVDKQSGLFTCKLTFSPVRPPIEFSSHLQRNNGIDFGFSLSEIWSNKILIDYSSKELQLSVDVLPSIPIKIFARMFDNKQFVLNMTTCSAFSAELAGTLSTDDEYQLVLTHKFFNTMFEDFKLSVNSLQHLNKLRLRWESKSGKELMKNLNTNMRQLMENILASLANVSESVRKMANETVNYMRIDGREKLMAAVNKSTEKILFLKEFVRNVKINDLIEKYSVRATKLLTKIQKNVLELVEEVKVYGSPMIDNYNYFKQTIKEISNELSPYTKTFTSDLKKLLSRTVNRYLTVSVCGVTIEEAVNMITSKTQLYYALVKDIVQRQVETCKKRCQEMKFVLQEVENLVKKAETTVQEFTCNYSMKCTKRNIQVELKKLAGRISFEHLNKLVEQLTQKYKELEIYALLTIKEKQLQEKAMRILQPIIDFLKTMTHTIKLKVAPLREKVEEFVKRTDMMVYYKKMKEQHKQLLKAVENLMVHTTKNVEAAKKNLLTKIDQAKDSMTDMKSKIMKIYLKMARFIVELENLTWNDVRVYAENEIEVNYLKLKEKLIELKKAIMEKVQFYLERHADEIERVKKFGEKLYKDVTNGRITVQDAQEKIEPLVKKLMEYIKEQKLKAMNKLKALKFDETATNTYQAGLELYRKTSEDLRQKVTALYPKVIKELKKLLVKIKKTAIVYVELIKSKALKLCDQKDIYLKKAMDKIQITKQELIKKMHELVELSKDYSLACVENWESEIMKLKEKYQNKLTEMITEYKTKLTTTVEQVKKNIINTLKSYQDMPIEDIYRNLRLKASVEFDKVLGFIIGKTLITYEEAMEKVKEIKEFYQRSKRETKAKWKKITDFVEELNKKYEHYRALVEKEYAKASKTYRDHYQPIVFAYYSALNDLRRDAMFIAEVKFEQLKLWYEHVKYIKLKEFYYNMREILAKWDFNLKDSCEKKFKIFVEEIKKIKTKLEDFIKDVREESLNVLTQIKQVNAEVKADVSKTFEPYERLVKKILLKLKTKTMEKLAPLNKKYEKMLALFEEYRYTTERYLKRRVQDIKDLDQDEITDMVIASLKQYPFLVQVKEFYEFILDGRLATQVIESLNRCPFLEQVRTHQLWFVLKEEILGHEIVVGSQQLGKTSLKKLRELSTDYYSRSLPKYRELKDTTYAGLEKFKKDMFAQNENIKKTINNKRKEISVKLIDTHKKLRSEGDRLMEEARDMYETGNKRFQETVERIGELSIHDIESHIREYLRNLLTPVKNVYVDFSEFVVAELLILDKQHRKLQERMTALQTSLMNQANGIYNQLKEMASEANEWGLLVLAKSKSKFDVDKLKNLSVKVLGHLEKYNNKGLAMGQRLIDEYVPYKDLLKLTPKQIIEKLQDVPGKAEKLVISIKEIIELYVDSAMQMLRKLKDSVDPEKMREMKEKARRLFNNTQEKMHFLATEILETTVFVTKFYGSPDTFYNVHPEVTLFANFQLQKFINCSRSFKAKAIEYYDEVRDVAERLFAQANYSYHNNLPRIVKFIKTEVKDLDVEVLQKMQKKAKVYLNMSKEYVEMKYAEVLAVLEITNFKLQEYFLTKRSEFTLKFDKAKEELTKIFKNEYEGIYKKVLVSLKDAKEFVQDQYVIYLREFNNVSKYYNTDIIAHLPILVKNTMGKLPLIFEMVKHDLKTLIKDGFDKLHEGKLYVEDEIIPMVKKTCIKNVDNLNKLLLQLRKSTTDVTDSVKNKMEKALPLVKEKILNIIDIIQKTEVAFAKGELELKLPSANELRSILSDLKTLFTEKYEIISVKLHEQYKEGKKNVKEILERLMEDTKATLKSVREDVPKFCESKYMELRELVEPKFKSLSTSVEMARLELKRIQKDAQEFCKEKRFMFYTKTTEAKEMIVEYVKMLLEESQNILEDLKIRVSRLERETKMKIKELQIDAKKINNDILEAVNEKQKELEKKIVAFYNSDKVKKYINRYVDVEDLMNKTIEIKEDILNMTMVHDLVEFGEKCYREGERLMDLAKESSEFAMYVIKRVIKYSDVWEIVQHLTNPFFWIPPSDSFAMIFGKPHVYTFDGKSYQFTGYKKPSCTYVLAHDFRDNNFTIMSQETALIINTKAGFIKVDANGQVEASVSKTPDGKKVKTTHYELPVEMMQMTVHREGSFIKIKHDTGLDVVCDLRHFLCTFNINKFYYGKLAGLLGTNNNEQYDEFLKPDKTIAKSVIEFANAWEVSGDPECKVDNSVFKNSCGKKPSPRCDQLFLNSSSPLASYFKIVDPKPFYNACIFDTSDCENDVPPSKSFCNVTAAYITLLREKGVWARQLQECVSCGSKGIWEKWTERGSKNVDVVLLIPETLNMKIHADNLPTFLKELQSDLSKYSPRYAVVGFGGKSSALRRPHIVTVGGKIFGGIKGVQSAISNMKFLGEAANAFEAIEYLAHLPFRPGASKVVIMLTDQTREAMSRAPLQEAIKELNMQGVVFNVVGPYFQKKQHRNVLGLWKGRAMMKKDILQRKLATIGLPSNDYTKLAESSQGGIFNLKAYSKEHSDWTNLLKRAMKTTIVKQIDEDQTYCRQCVCVPSLTTEPVTICRINRHSRCS